MDHGQVFLKILVFELLGANITHALSLFAATSRMSIHRRFSVVDLFAHFAQILIII